MIFTHDDLWRTAYMLHLAAIGARLCPRVAFECCDSPGCVQAQVPGVLRPEEQ